MFTGDSKLDIGTKLSIIRGSILKISGGGGYHPPSVRRVTKNGSVRRGLNMEIIRDELINVNDFGNCKMI